jgi:serine protease AprX
VAPGAKLISLRVLDGNGQGYVSSIINAIDWTIKNRDKYGIRVLNMSFGHPPAESYRTDPLDRAVERAWSAGLVVVASAGNRGRDGHFTINAPGNDPYVLTIGAMNDLNTTNRTDDVITT